MYQTITFSGFVDAFRDHGREEQFSYEAKRLLFDYFEEIGQETTQSVELDVIAICCEYAESSLDDVIDQYSIDTDDIDDADKEEKVIEYLQYNTSYVGKTTSGNFVFAQF